MNIKELDSTVRFVLLSRLDAVISSGFHINVLELSFNLHALLLLRIYVHIFLTQALLTVNCLRLQTQNITWFLDLG